MNMIEYDLEIGLLAPESTHHQLHGILNRALAVLNSGCS